MRPSDIWETESLCPCCLRKIPARIEGHPLGAVMKKSCPDHGSSQALVSTDLATYESLRRAVRKITSPNRSGVESKKGCPDDCGLCPSHVQHTCLAILEITSRCDLGCPVCLASSSRKGKELPLPAVEAALKALARQEGRTPPLQFSGGEPTLHNDLEEILRSAASLGFGKIEIDTNGLRLAEDPSLAEKLVEAGLSQVYLQMDGLDPEVSRFIRGRDLVEKKWRAIENSRRAGLQVALSVTVVPGVNSDGLWKMVRFGLEEKLTGVHFQSVALSGRFPESLANGMNRFTLGHFLQNMEKQSDGRIRTCDFIPLPCPDPRCGAMLYGLVRQGEIVPLSRLCAAEDLVVHAADMSDWDAVLASVRPQRSGTCGCPGSCPEGIDWTGPFGDCEFYSIGFHGMMDVYDFDLDRARHCCVHELTPDGRLIPFCLYNIKYRGA